MYYDARYFYEKDGVGCTVSHYVDRCVYSVIESECQFDLLQDNRLLKCIRDSHDNPSVLGFLVEKAVISHLSNIQILAKVLNRRDLLHERVVVRKFGQGTEQSWLDSNATVALYIPEDFNYKAVDAVIRIIDRPVKKLLASPSRKSKRTKTK